MVEDDQNKDEYLDQQGKIITDLLMRVVALERVLMEKEILTEAELMTKIEDAHGEILTALTEALQKRKNNETKS